MKAIKKILVAADFSETTAAVVETACVMAGKFGASVDLVHVREPFVRSLATAGGTFGPTAETVNDWTDEALVRLAGRFSEAGIPCLTTTLDGSPAGQIVGHARRTGADLVIVGTHGLRGIAHAVLGSVAERVVQKAGRPVLVVSALRPAAEQPVGDHREPRSTIGADRR